MGQRVHYAKYKVQPIYQDPVYNDTDNNYTALWWGFKIIELIFESGFELLDSTRRNCVYLSGQGYGCG